MVTETDKLAKFIKNKNELKINLWKVQRNYLKKKTDETGQKWWNP